MKVYSLTLSVRIALIGEMDPEPVPAQPALSDNLPDDPVKASAVILDRLDHYLTKSAPPMFPGQPVENDQMAMNETHKIVATNFEELQAVLAKFHATAESCTLEGVIKR